MMESSSGLQFSTEKITVNNIFKNTSAQCCMTGKKERWDEEPQNYITQG